jgi:hypothetical protein
MAGAGIGFAVGGLQLAVCSWRLAVGLAGPRVEKRPVDPITPFPTGRTLFYFGARHFVPGYLRIVPSGQRLSTPIREFDARLRQTERRRFEDEDDDEEEDE